MNKNAKYYTSCPRLLLYQTIFTVMQLTMERDPKMYNSYKPKRNQLDPTLWVVASTGNVLQSPLSTSCIPCLQLTMELVYCRNSLLPIPYPQGEKVQCHKPESFGLHELVFKLVLEHHWELHTRFVPRLSIPNLVFQLWRKFGMESLSVRFYTTTRNFT